MTDTIPLLDRSTEHLEGSVRLTNILSETADSLPEWAELETLPRPRTIGALIQWSKCDLARLPRMGRNTLRELEGLLKGFDLSLRHPDEDRTRLLSKIHPGPSFLDDADTKAVDTIVRCLRSLPATMQGRVLDAVCTLIDHTPRT